MWKETWCFQALKFCFISVGFVCSPFLASGPPSLPTDHENLWVSDISVNSLIYTTGTLFTADPYARLVNFIFSVFQCECVLFFWQVPINTVLSKSSWQAVFVLYFLLCQRNRLKFYVLIGYHLQKLWWKFHRNLFSKIQVPARYSHTFKIGQFSHYRVCKNTFIPSREQTRCPSDLQLGFLGFP